MRSPFSSESEGYEFVLLTVAAFPSIALASLLGGPWAGIPAWAILTAAVVVLYARRGRASRRLRTAPPRAAAAGGPRILVLALDALADDALEAIHRAEDGGRAVVLVVRPAPVSTLRHWTSDVDGGRARAQQELDRTLSRLREAGVDAAGVIGDEDVLRAVEDALRTFTADEILVCGQRAEADPAPVAAVRERFAVPVTHVQGRAEASPSSVL